MFTPTMIALQMGATEVLERAEATAGEMSVEDIRKLLAVKYELDRMSDRVTNALTREAANA